MWVRALSPQGYGDYSTGGRQNHDVAHRVMYRFAHGEIPPRHEIDHLCRNRACVNPQHLEAVTTAENQRRGKNAKLTAAEVVAIREAVAAGAHQSAVAAQHGVSASAVSHIVTRRKWRNL